MGAGHVHGVHQTATGRHRRRLVLVLGMTLVVLVVEFVGGLLSGSLALLADAGHMLTDVCAIALALLAASFAARPATPERTFGYQRGEILAAVANAVVLLLVAVLVVVGAVRRWSDPPELNSGLMFAVAIVGLLASALAVWLLQTGQAESMNVRGVYLEALGDLFGSASVVVAALVIAATGWTAADIVASFVVAVLIVPRTWSLLRDALNILLEATPRHVDLAAVREHITDVDGVIDVHDLHAWTITSGVPVLSAHVVVSDVAMADGGAGRVLDRLGECLSGHFDVEHCTFQVEPAGHRDHEAAHHD
jgi:cobalt-zinc-cadmium efflux system protein